MKYIISALCCVAVVVADKLNNVYLPPISSSSAGGNGDILRLPFQAGRQFYSGNSQISQRGSAYVNQQQIFQQRNIYSNQQQPAIKSYSSGFVQPQVAILRFNNDNNGEGTYRFDYETENRISQQESGKLKNAGNGQESSVVQGAYSYVGPDGQTYTINYVADELGFRATGDHLPVAPPIPVEIQKSLEKNAADEARGIVYDGQYRPDASEGVRNTLINRQYLTPKVQVDFPQTHNQGGYKY